MPKEWFELNSYIKIGENGVVTLMAPNPEFGSDLKNIIAHDIGRRVGCGLEA